MRNWRGNPEARKKPFTYFFSFSSFFQRFSHCSPVDPLDSLSSLAMTRRCPLFNIFALYVGKHSIVSPTPAPNGHFFLTGRPSSHFHRLSPTTLVRLFFLCAILHIFLTSIRRVYSYTFVPNLTVPLSLDSTSPLAIASLVLSSNFSIPNLLEDDKNRKKRLFSSSSLLLLPSPSPSSL